RHTQVERLTDPQVMARLLIIECVRVVVRRTHLELPGGNQLEPDHPNAGRDEIWCGPWRWRAGRWAFRDRADGGRANARGDTGWFGRMAVLWAGGEHRLRDQAERQRP